MDAERIHYFCKCLINKAIVPEWGCQGVRIDSLLRVDFGLLEKSGCKHLYVGVESGSEKILKYIKKGITIKQIKDIIHRFSNSEIIAHYNFMVGYPVEEIEDIFKTVELVNSIMKVDPKGYFSSFHLITPYPGTEFYEIAQQYGFTHPAKLEEWINIRWESIRNVSWVSPKIKKIDLNLALLTYFIDRKVLDKTENSILLNAVTRILMILAKFHWKHRKLQFCPEFNLLYKLINYKINCEIHHRN